MPAVDPAVRAEAEKLELEIFAAIPSDSRIIDADLDQSGLLVEGESSPAQGVAEQVLAFQLSVNE